MFCFSGEFPSAMSILKASTFPNHNFPKINIQYALSVLLKTLVRLSILANFAMQIPASKRDFRERDTEAVNDFRCQQNV